MVCFSQSLSHRAQLAIDDLFSSRGWLDKMLRGVPDQVLATHPFYRIPGVKQSFRRCFCKENAVSSSLSHVSLVPLLSECRLLLKKPVLSNEETEALLGYMERLCGYASRLLPTRAPPTLKVCSVEVLGKAFVVLDTLHCAAEVLGQSSKKEQWWPDIVSHIENARYMQHVQKTRKSMGAWSNAILNGLDTALEFYRMGERPPLRLVLGLKLALFLSPKSTRLNTSKWDPWRGDALEWLQLIKPSIQASGQ